MGELGGRLRKQGRATTLCRLKWFMKPKSLEDWVEASPEREERNDIQRIRLTIIWSISFHRHFTSGFVFSSSNPSKKRKSWWHCRSGSWNVGWGERPAIGGGPRGEGRGPRFTQEEVEDSVLGVDEDDLVVDVLRLWTLKPRKGLV
ncbi:hypothetical protein CRG98_021573, partial [Punica granatum]